MAITYQFEVQGELLLVTASGKDEGRDDVKQYGRAVLECALANAVTRVLCDERKLEYALDLLSTFESAKYMAEIVPKVARVAIVCKPGKAPHADFWETVAVNRGLQVRMMTDLAEATTWVLQDDRNR